MWDITQLRDFINTMVETTVTLGGIAFAIVLFTVNVYRQRLEEYRKHSEHMTVQQRMTSYLQLLRYWVVHILTILSALILLLGPLVIILFYRLGSVEPNLAGLLLVMIYAVGMLLLIVPVRLLIVGKPEV